MGEKKIAKTAHDKDKRESNKHLCRMCRVSEVKVIKYLGNGPIQGLYWTCAACGFSESTTNSGRIAVVTDKGIHVCDFAEAHRICLKPEKS